MKFAYYSVAGLALAGLGLVPFSASPVAKMREPAPAVVEQVAVPSRVAYVDIAGLLNLHPGWQALSDMRVTIAGAGRADATLERAEAVVVKDIEPLAVQSAKALRGRLELESVRAAVDALHRLEQDKHEALWLRLDSRKAQLAAESEKRISVQSGEIERMAAAAVREMEQKNSPLRLNAQLKLAATQVAAGADKDGATGAAGRLEQVRSALRHIDDAGAAEREEIVSVAAARIAAVRDAEMAELDRRTAAEESARRSALTQSMMRMRGELLDSLQVEYESSRGWSALTRHGSSVSLADRTSGIAGRPGLDELRKAAADLEARVRNDVERAVRELAADEGVEVVFTRSGGARDATAEFTKLMSKRGGLLFGPVLVSGSS